MVRARRAGVQSYEWAYWDSEKLTSRLRSILDTKGSPHHVFGGPFDDYVVLIHTAEPGLEASAASGWLEGIRFSCSDLVTKAYLLFSYSPHQSGYPVVRLDLASHSPGSDA